MRLTEEGQKIFEEIQKGSVTVDAVAGAGKSTLAAHICNNTRDRVQYIVYTRANKASMGAKVGTNTNVQTINAYGKSILDSQLGFRTTPMADAHLRTMESLGVEPNYTTQQAWDALRLQNPLLGPDSSASEWNEALEDLGCDDRNVSALRGSLLMLAQETIQSIQDTGATDFVDQLWAPLHLEGLEDVSVDYLVLDEANDASPATVELLRRTAKGRVLTIGDRFQTIFEFAGAYIGNMDDVTVNHGSKWLPLTNCWRCPQAVIEFVQDRFVPHITTTNTSQGSVDYDYDLSKEDISGANLVLSARYSSLLPYLFEALTEGVPCFVEGRDFISGVLKDFSYKNRQAKTRSMSDEEWFETQADFYLRAARRMRPTAGNVSKIQKMLDKSSSFSVFASSGLDLLTLSSLLKRATDCKDSNAVRFSSIHRAKGLEADNVVVLASEATDEWVNSTPGHLHDEALRLMYVACTRAKQHLKVQLPSPSIQG